MKLKDKVVLITGAAGGIGRGVAAVCRDEGAHLALVDMNMPALEKAAEALGLDMNEHLLVCADVTDEAQVENYVSKTVERFGRIDVFHNNAGTTGSHQQIKDLDLAAYERFMKINLYGMLMGMKYVLRVMCEQKSGSIINTSSQAGIRPQVGGSDYCLQKSAMIMLSKIAALENSSEGVRINAIMPGIVDSDMMRTNIEKNGGDYNEFKAMAGGGVPIGRMCDPRDIGNLIAFLGCDESAYITGTAIRIDGGSTAEFM